METKLDILNKAIETNDVVLLDGETVIPMDLTGKKLYYLDQAFNGHTINTDNADIEEVV